MIKLAVSGCHGRMGQRITALALKDKAFKIFALLESKDRPDAPSLSHHIPVNFEDAALKGSDVLIEFTTPQATIEHLIACKKYGVGMVIGTTGLDGAQIRKIHHTSKNIPIVFSSNMSVGVNLVFGLIRQAGRVTGKNYKVHIKETHHIHKKDAPSGTAKTMAEIAHGSSGVHAGIESFREGEVVGDHAIFFESPVDSISIHHHAKTRDIFAQGALVAAKFLSGKKKGLFNMQDVLGLK